MRHFPFLSDVAPPPRPGNAARARLGLSRWLDAVTGLADAGAEKAADEMAGSKEGRAILEAVFGNSPFLTQCAVIDPAFFARLLAVGPERALADIDDDLRRCLAGDGTEPLGALLRAAKRRASLAIGLADIFDLWPVEKIMGALSAFAELTVASASNHLLGVQARAGAIDLPALGEPARGSGLIVLAMGKLGARELNYSSDIDLIVLYDQDVVRTDRPERLQQTFVRLTQDLVKLLSERTQEGYVFRTDLRLRPDPGATPIALSVLAAETYYESIGQNWERAAMIKARQVAGDTEAGAAFLERLGPFVWRKNLDFAAIQDIHSIKRQINAHYGDAEIAVAGHNVKLGRGGIREIEFFAQTQQLIWGGRDPELRQPATSAALRALAAAGHITEAATRELIAAYRFLRRVEHRLQMIDDQQTHALPEADEGLAELAAFLGYGDSHAFTGELVGHLRCVEHHYAELFEDAPSLGGRGEITGNLIFTGSEDDPGTLETLSRLGFEAPASIAATVRSWHHGRYRATRSVRTRQLLTELMPVILAAFARAPEPGAAFAKFDEFLSNLPSGVQLFSMFHAHPELLDLMTEVMGSAPRLAQHLSHNASVLDGVLEADFLKPFPSLGELKADLRGRLAEADGFEDVLDLARRWTNDHKLQAGIRMLRNMIGAEAAAWALSDIADAALAELATHVEDEFARRHGRVAGTRIAIVAMGKLGSREMTPTSDLDLIFIYDHDAEAAASDGEKPLMASQYFARLSQRLINAITAPTQEGRLYEVDMRLRPSGNAGPIASSLEAFAKYQASAAWTWEHMALTRARIISAPDEMSRRIRAIIDATLTRRRDGDALLADVADMRQRMDREHHSDLIWEVKHHRGGLVDIEFIAQYLLLAHAHDHPDLPVTGTRDMLRGLRARGMLEPAHLEILLDAHALSQAVQGTLRLTIEGYFRADDETEVPEALSRLLVAATGTEDFVALQARLASTADAVQAIFRELIETPAQALAERAGGTRDATGDAKGGEIERNQE